MAANNLEVWQRGPVAGIPALLQPVAHALLQAREEIERLMEGFHDAWLWERPAGVASPAFHLQHLIGVLDRLFTYARAEALSAEQLEYLEQEAIVHKDLTTTTLLERFTWQVEQSIRQLENTPEDSLTEVRGVGRKQIPSTVIGLLFHAAEHTMRHTGQLIVTVSVLKSKE
ncbi:DinB family protein [Chitinophaga horti]|uniref:DinB family protein n=1 Tax=Chitinophaga horti TaxID=2920382 RepID=A0ABY6IV67_9BACT|nr:DinB family protein [Chitinophaga horti]UYQ91263.1 DinB family protein [Chitinophaga horti]